MIGLEKAKIELFSSYLDFISEMQAAGEKIWEGMIPKAGENAQSFVRRLLDSEKNPEAGLVAATTYWATIGSEVVGRIQLRHELNDDLKVFGGHVGYEVRPSRRRLGIATMMLREVLKTLKAQQIGRILVTCAPDNLASNKTIVANGGVLHHQKFVERINRPTNYYWIEINV
jgi:predicted acetyltransferase